MRKLYKHYQKEVNDKPSFLVGQKAFIVNTKRQVLIIKRHNKSTQSGKWDFPGGRIEFGESLRNSLIREVKEEAGLTIQKVSIPLSITSFMRDIDTNTQIVRIVYLCKTKGKVKISEEHAQEIWINPTTYRKYDFIAKDYIYAFQNYLKLNSKIIEFLHEGMV